MASAPTSTLPRVPVAAHIAELRSRLFICVTVLLAGTMVGYALRDTLLHVLVAPLDQPLYYTSPGGGFNFIIQLCLAFGFLWAIPVVIFHILRFVEPILPHQRNRLIATSLVASCLLMAAGISFAYLVSLPAALQFLNGFSSREVSALISTDTYLSFVVTYLAAFALLFQLPLILLVVNTITPLPPRTLLGKLKWVVLAAFVVAAVITPTQDPVNQAIMAGPMIGLYLAACGGIWLINRRHGPRPDLSMSVEERLMNLSRAKLVARRETTAPDGRVGTLCQWEERRRGKFTRRLTTFHDGVRHELVWIERT